MSGRGTIFVVEDEADVGALICNTLSEHEFEVQRFASGEAAKRAIDSGIDSGSGSGGPDVLIVDLGLPDMDGLELVKRYWQNPAISIIILSARGQAIDRILGLEVGADDYIAKPFEPREVVARVKSLLRRREQLVALSEPVRGQMARFAEWHFDPSQLTLTSAGGDKQTLSAAEAQLLMAFLKAPNRVLPRDRLMESERMAYDRSIDIRISRIRKKIEETPKDPRIIKTVYGAGYIFAAKVTWE